MRLIDATKAEERIVALYRKEQGAFADAFNTAIDACQNIILDMYDNESVEQKTGKWIECDHDKWVVGVHGLRCSECNGGYHLNSEITIYYWNYCPNCGTRMESEEE